MHNKRLIQVTLLLLAQGLLAACGPPTIRDTANQSYLPIRGGTFELHNDISIPAGRARVYFQYGEITAGINEFAPHCQLRVRDVADRPQPVQADSFRIETVRGTDGEVVDSGRLRLAAAGDLSIASGNGDGPTRLGYFYYMGLRSERQPQVSYLVCAGVLDEPWRAEYPTLQDIRGALGGQATLVISGRTG